MAAAPVYAQESLSATHAKELATLLDQAKLDSIAAKVPDTSDQFVAALYYPGAQLLVVSTRYSQPTLLREQIWARKYRDVYAALHAGGERDGKFFVVDMGGNGLPALNTKGQQIDIVYENATTQTTFNGDWKAQKLSETAYGQRLKTADERYLKMLETLAAALKTTASQ